MRKLFWMLATSVALLAGCVTINVYFPAAAAQQAADKIISNVIGEGAQGTAPAQPQQQPASSGSSGGGGPPLGVRMLDALIPAASAAEPQPDIKIQSPQIEAIQSRMRDRFDSTLKTLLDSGAVGFTRDGLVAVHDASKAPLAQRAQMNSAVLDENSDRAALYQQIAVANGHPEWEKQIQQIFAKQWIDHAHSGWYYQDASGAWQRK